MKARRWLGWSKKETIEGLSLSGSLKMQGFVSLFVQCISLSLNFDHSYLMAGFNFNCPEVCGRYSDRVLSLVGHIQLQTLICWPFLSSNSIDPDWTSTSPELQGLQQRFWVQGQPHPQQLEGYEKVLSFPSSSFKFNWPSWWNKQTRGRQNRAVFGEIPPSLFPWMVPCLVLSC